MDDLQKLYTQYQSQNLVMLGFNSCDDKKIALDQLHEHNITFPNIVDTSRVAQIICSYDYGSRGVPLNYVIDRDGKIVASWYGYELGHPEAKAALAKVGIK